MTHKKQEEQDKSDLPVDIPEKARLLEKLRAGDFNVPDFVYVPAEQFRNESFGTLETFLDRHQESYKVIARSAHPQESFFKGGTFDSLETYADIGGIKYARKRMIKLANTTKRLSIKRQQKFNGPPLIDSEEMGVIVMPFITGSSVMAKMIWDHWEFGYGRDRIHKVRSEPFITRTPHDIRLLNLSETIQQHLGFPCEIEYIISSEGKIYVVQAKDISNIEILEQEESRRTIRLDGIRRIRKRRNYRERPLFVMDNRAFYLNIIGRCEDWVSECMGTNTGIEGVTEVIAAYEAELEAFSLKHQRFCVLGMSIQNPDDLYQVANHYIDEVPTMQEQLSQALTRNLYKIDIFLSEADTLIAKNRVRINLGSHDAYGIDTVRNPIWTVYWNADRHAEITREFKNIGFTTGDVVGIELDINDNPTIYRL